MSKKTAIRRANGCVHVLRVRSGFEGGWAGKPTNCTSSSTESRMNV
jgi:hypothetical protein